MRVTTESREWDRIYLCAVPFDETLPVDEEKRLRDLARDCLLHPEKRRPGKNVGRILAYYAGRAGAALLFRNFRVEGFIKPNPHYGYLEVVTRNLSPISGFFVNITHTNGLAVAALASQPVGVDIEALSRDASRALSRVATARERETASRFKFSNSGTPGGGASLWSIKEAAGKAVGLGIKFGLRAFTVYMEGEGETSFPIEANLPVTPPLEIPNLAGRVIEYRNFVVSVCADGTLLKKEPKFI